MTTVERVGYLVDQLLEELQHLPPHDASAVAELEHALAQRSWERDPPRSLPERSLLLHILAAILVAPTADRPQSPSWAARVDHTDSLRRLRERVLREHPALLQPPTDEYMASRSRVLRALDEAAQEPAGPERIRRFRSELKALAAEHGLHDVRVTPTGRLLVRLDGDRSLWDLAVFQTVVSERLGGHVGVVSAAAVANEGHGADLEEAVPL